MRHIQRINPVKRFSHACHLQAGFTIVELTVVIVMLGVLLPIFSTLFIDVYHDTYTADRVAKATYETKQALSYMEDNVRVSNGFLAAVPTPFTDPYGPHNNGSSNSEAWSYKGDSSKSRFLITKSYATNSNGLATARQPVFINTANYNCSTQMYYQPQLSFITIYFMKDTTLYKRLLTDTSTAVCPGNTQAQKQTCPPYIAVSSRDASCGANDEILAKNVSEFSTKYYQISKDGSSTQIDPSFSSTDQTVLDPADYVIVTLTMSTTNGNTVGTVSQRMVKINQ